jgi:hypothetical protein
MRYILTELAPLDGADVVSLALAKQQLRVTNTAEDALIGVYTDAALAWIERYCSISLAPRAWQIDCEDLRRLIHARSALSPKSPRLLIWMAQVTR